MQVHGLSSDTGKSYWDSSIRFFYIKTYQWPWLVTLGFLDIGDPNIMWSAGVFHISKMVTPLSVPLVHVLTEMSVGFDFIWFE